MNVMIKGPFKAVVQIRNFVQGDDEPYLYGNRGGFTVTGLDDDRGAGESVLLLSPSAIAGKKPSEIEQQRKVFIDTVRKSNPSLRVEW